MNQRKGSYRNQDAAREATEQALGRNCICIERPETYLPSLCQLITNISSSNHSQILFKCRVSGK